MVQDPNPQVAWGPGLALGQLEGPSARARSSKLAPCELCANRALRPGPEEELRAQRLKSSHHTQLSRSLGHGSNLSHVERSYPFPWFSVHWSSQVVFLGIILLVDVPPMVILCKGPFGSTLCSSLRNLGAHVQLGRPDASFARAWLAINGKTAPPKPPPPPAGACFFFFFFWLFLTAGGWARCFFCLFALQRQKVWRAKWLP